MTGQGLRWGCVTEGPSGLGPGLAWLEGLTGGPQTALDAQNHTTMTMKQRSMGHAHPIDNGEAKGHNPGTQKRAQDLLPPSPILLFHKQSVFPP